MFIFKTGLTGITESDVLLNLNITIGTIAFFAMRMFMFFFSDGLRTADTGQVILIILDGQLKGIRPQVGAVQFIFGQSFQCFGHIFIGELLGFFQAFALGDFGDHTRYGNSRAASECLKFNVRDTFVFYFQIDRHHITAKWITDLTNTIGIIDHPDVTRISKVVHNRLIVHASFLLYL